MEFIGFSLFLILSISVPATSQQQQNFPYSPTTPPNRTHSRQRRTDAQPHTPYSLPW